MAFTESEIAEHGKMIEEVFWSKRRPPLHLRDKIREGLRIEDQSIELFFVRPLLLRPEESYEDAIAKIRFVRSSGVWQIFWKRADLKWHRYQPHPETQTLTQALEVIAADEYCCFFG